jgi:aldose 1-epimerase
MPPPAPGAPPPDRNWLAIEPMAGITDAPNLLQKDLYKGLQTVPAGGTWQAVFRVVPKGF